jgi:polysaccharide deacetylase family protein (PEP-CTERM system associated)
MTTHGLTFDLESWHQLVRRRVTGETKPAESSVVAMAHRFLDVCDETRTRATFFVVGLLAKQYPDLVREIAKQGHEIGSHSYEHRLLTTLSRSELHADLERSKKQLEDLTGKAVVGFRAPEFSVQSTDHFCFEVLAELGFKYDSSVFPTHGARYGIPTASRLPFSIETPAGAIREFPLATLKLGRAQLPIAGGSYFRLIPGAVLQRALRSAEADGCTAVLYFHPYEFSEDWLYVPGLGLKNLSIAKSLALHNFRTSKVRERLVAMLRSFRFAPLGELH